VSFEELNHPAAEHFKLSPTQEAEARLTNRTCGCGKRVEIRGAWKPDGLIWLRCPVHGIVLFDQTVVEP
jgi:hypothetical protein